MIRVGESIRLRGAYVKSGVGVAGLTVALSYTDESGNATTGLTATAGAIAGEYYYALAPDAAGLWLFKMVTAGDVDTKEIFGVIEVESALTAARAANLDNLDAAVTTRLAAGAYTTPPTASAIADQTWDEALSGHVVAGSAGVALAAAGGASDPLLNAVPGTYAQGTAGSALGRIGSGTIATVSLISPPGTALTLVRGDDYALADGRAIAFTLATTWPDLTGAAVVLTVRSRASDAVLFSVGDRAASRVTGSGVAQVVVFEPSASATVFLVPGLASGKFDVQATLVSGHIVTVATGLVTVTEDQTRLA